MCSTFAPSQEEEEPNAAYRGLPTGSAAPSAAAVAMADASWLAGERPPLVKRQRAFNREGADDWLGL